MIGMRRGLNREVGEVGRSIEGKAGSMGGIEEKCD